MPFNDGTTQGVEDPVSPEMVAGGSYIPQEQDVQAQIPSMPGYNPDDLQGDASDVNDAFFTMNGIVNGDPMGMETFNLGFFDDGTPAIQINGANIPIQHGQWMALLSQRQKTRSEIKARLEFAVRQKKARDGISKIIASAPNIPPQLGQLLWEMTSINPDMAMQETQQLLVSMSKDNGRQQIGKLSTMLQDNAVSTELSRLTREVETQIGEDAAGTPIMGKTSPVRSRASDLSKDRDPRKRKTAYAISNIDSMFPPKGMKADPSINGKPVGVFDIMALMDGADTSELSRFELLRHLAAYSDLWPSKVDWVDDPTPMQGQAGVQFNPNDINKFRNYLLELDQWASSALKWDRSDPRTIDFIMQQKIASRSMLGNQPAQQPQPQNPTTAENPLEINFGS